ncbi:MAG: DUF695 domain-containing protein [Thermoanaerobaculia bacterium]
MKLLDFFRGRRDGKGAVAPEDLEPKPEEWSVVTIRNAELGQSVVMRVRFEKPGRADLATLRAAIVVKWPYESENRMPPPETNRLQLDFERALDPLMPSEESELVHVSTGLGLKEWIFYARDSGIFLERFNELLAGHPAYPLEIEIYDDPDWKVWAEMVDSLRERTDS